MQISRRRPSSRMTLSPKTLTSIAFLVLCTSLVRISLIGFDLAFTSIAHIPRIIGGRLRSVVVERSECEALGEGVDALVVTEGDRGRDRSGDPKIDAIRDGLLLSQCMSCCLRDGGWVSPTYFFKRSCASEAVTT